MINLLLLNIVFLLVIFVEANNLPNGRPNIDERTFSSPIIDNIITNLIPYFIDNNIAVLFSNCWPNSLDTTINNYNFQNMDA